MDHEFKQTEIGLIPNDWDLTKIGQVAKINELNLNNSFSHEEIEYIDVSSVKERLILEIKKIPIGKAPNRAKRIIRDNDILISTVRPNLKHYTFIKKSKPNILASTGFCVITSKEVNPHFLYYYLTSEYFTNFLTAIADTHASTYPAFTPNVIETSMMPFPFALEQRVIGKILSDFDTKIELNYKMNHTLESVGRTLFNKWFVDFNFPSSTGNPFKSSGGKMIYSEGISKEIPKSWKEGSIGDIASVQAGYGFKSNNFLDKGSFGVIKISNITDNVVDIQDTQYVSRKTVSLLDKKFLIKPGSILIAMTGANVGKIGVVPKTNKQLWLNQRVGMFKEEINKGLYFIYLLLSSNKYQRILRGRAFGTAQPNISCKDIESLDIILPPKKIVTQFGILFEPFFNKIIENLYENQKLSELRDILLPKLIFGRLRINQLPENMEKL